MRKRLLACLIALSLLPVFAAAEDGDWAVEIASDMACVMDELVRDEGYLSLFTTSDDIKTLAQNVAAGDYQSGAESLVVAIPGKDKLPALLAELSIDVPAFSDGAWDELMRRTPSVLVSAVNAGEGVNMVALTACFQLTRGYAVPDDAETCMVALDFGGDYCILVGMYVEDGVAVATSSFVTRAGYDRFLAICGSHGLI